MEKISLNVGTIFCFDCVMALRKFIGGLKGVSAVEVDDGRVAVHFDSSVISAREITEIARNNIEKLGYKVLD